MSHWDAKQARKNFESLKGMIKVLTKTTVIEDIHFAEGYSDTLVNETILLLGLRRIDQELSFFSQNKGLFIRVEGQKIHFDGETQELVVPLSATPEELVLFLKANSKDSLNDS